MIGKAVALNSFRKELGGTQLKNLKIKLGVLGFFFSSTLILTGLSPAGGVGGDPWAWLENELHQFFSRNLSREYQFNLTDCGSYYDGIICDVVFWSADPTESCSEVVVYRGDGRPYIYPQTAGDFRGTPQCEAWMDLSPSSE